MTPNLEAIVPGLGELRALERTNRALAFAGLGHKVCGREVRPLTPRHRLTLQLLQNAFTAPAAVPLEGDVFQFLWVLSPAYRFGEGGRVAAEVRQWLLRRHVRRLNVGTASREIRVYLTNQLQDLPESDLGAGSDVSTWVHWVAMDAAFWMETFPSFTLERYLATPYLVLQQLYRAWRVHNPRVTTAENGRAVVEEPSFINASDRLLGKWQRGFHDEIANRIRNQTTRLP